FRHDPWVSDMIEEVLAGDGGGIRTDGEIASLWRKAVPVRASASPTVDSQGLRTGVAVILQDLTLQVGLEADLQRAQSVSHLGAVVSGLAHEIKNPLSGIRGAVQLLGRETGSNPAAADYVALVLRELDRLTHLVERLLQLGARGKLPPGAVNVHEVVEHVLALTAADSERASVKVVRSFDPSLPMVKGHQDSLIQVFLNLVQNALHAVSAVPEGAPREIRLSTRIETDYHFAPASGERRRRTRFLRVDVEDTGPGIPADLQPKLFSPFFTTKPTGTGLGLAVSHRIVSDHGGTIRFESAPGRTVFRVILPALRKRAE
ncbi:MAG: two-component system sensor histidine kinase NtrB, partial [Candidatus Binatia bacterium]